MAHTHLVPRWRMCWRFLSLLYSCTAMACCSCPKQIQLHWTHVISVSWSQSHIYHCQWLSCRKSFEGQTSRFKLATLYLRGHAVAQWLRHCATNQKIAGSIPDGVIGIFHWHNPSGSTMALGSTQRLPGIFPGGKGGRCVRLTTLPHSCAYCLKIWEPQPPGTLRACQDL
jgi:hypothetical protein